MHGSYRATAAVLLLVVASAGLLAGCATDGSAAGDPTRTSRPTVGPGDKVVRVLQMNLCNSGHAACYSGGRSISKALSLIHHHRPTMVTVNEVCRGDVGALERAMSAAFPAAGVASSFTSARDRALKTPVRCENGQRYGDGVLVVVPSSPHGFRSYRGVYPVQDARDVEERVWVCIDVVTRFAACTTHTASTSPTVAVDQCRYLLDSALPTINRRDHGNPVILGADLNLAARGSPSPQACLPAGYQRVADGAVQDVVVGPGIRVRSRSVVDMGATTDHPGLLVDVALTRR